MKLKTLKDIFEEYNCGGVSEVFNNESLRDKLSSLSVQYWLRKFKNQQRQEAIKWIKVLRSYEEAWENKEQSIRHNKEHPEWNQIYNLLGAVEPTLDIVVFIAEIFNIKESEIK